METENIHVYPLMNKHFSDEDWEDISRRVGDVHNPLFGTILREDFSDLYQYILDIDSGKRYVKTDRSLMGLDESI